MKRFAHWFSLSTLMLVTVLSACAAPAAPAPTPAPTPASAVSTPSPARPELARNQLIDAAKKEGEVAIWANTFPDADKVMKPFSEKYPFIRVKVWDAASGGDAINKIVEEGKVGRVTADIFVGTEADLVKAVGLGILQEYDWKTQGWRNQPLHKFYINYATNGRFPAFNTNAIPADQGPKSWEDLALPKWRDKSPMTSFSAAEHPMLFAYMWREKEGVLNWEKTEKFLTDVVKNNKPRVVRGFPMEELITGEAGIFLPDLSGRNALRYVFLGAPIALVPVGKTPGLSNSVGIVKNAAHPNAAKVFADWFAAEGGQLSKIQADLTYALDPEIARVSPINKLLKGKYNIEVEPVPSEIYTPENVKRATDFWLKLLGVR